MNFSAEKATGNGLLAPLTAERRQWLPPWACAAWPLMAARRGARDQAHAAVDLFGRPPKLRGSCIRRDTAPRPRPAEAPTGRDRRSRGGQAGAAEAAPSPQAAAALGLPAGADRRDRDRAEHSRHQGARRLRRRGPGAARGHRAAGQARVPVKPAATLRCTMATAIADWIRTDMVPLAARLGSHAQRARQFQFLRMPRPQPRRRREAVRARPRQCARRARLKLANGQIDLADRPQPCRASCARACCIRSARGSPRCSGRAPTGITRTTSISTSLERRNNYQICQWDVSDPLPQVAPLMPAERPEEAPPREVAANADGEAETQPKPEAAESRSGKRPRPSGKPAPAKPKPTKKRR